MGLVLSQLLPICTLRSVKHRSEVPCATLANRSRRDANGEEEELAANEKRWAQIKDCEVSFRQHWQWGQGRQPVSVLQQLQPL